MDGIDDDELEEDDVVDGMLEELDEDDDVEGIVEELDEDDDDVVGGMLVVVPVVVVVEVIVVPVGEVRVSFPQVEASLENITNVPDFVAQMSTIRSCAKKR